MGIKLFMVTGMAAIKIKCCIH